MRLHKKPIMHVSNPAVIESSVGGAALNSASIAAYHGLETILVSPVGDDIYADNIRQTCKNRNIKAHLPEIKNHTTGLYTALIDPGGDVLIGAADLFIYDTITPEWLNTHLADYKQKNYGLFLTSNLSKMCIREVIDQFEFVAAACISPAKAKRLIPFLDRIDLLFCNLKEARSLCALKDANAKQLAHTLYALGVKSGIISDGENALTYWHLGKPKTLNVPKLDKGELVDVNGAGDALAGAMLAGIGKQQDFQISLIKALRVASYSLTHKGPYPYG